MRKVFVLLVVGLISILLFSSVPLTLATYDECETDPSQCQCSFNTCLGGCLSIDPITIAGCAVYHAEVALQAPVFQAVLFAPHVWV